jgi:hypothetical protein
LPSGDEQTPKNDRERLISLFRRSNLAAGAVHVVLAVFVLIEVIRRPWDVPFSVAYSKWTETVESSRCGEGNNTCTISLEQRDAGVFNIGLLVPFFSIVSGLHHLIAFVKLRKSDGYITAVETTGGNLYRAIDYAISSSLMIVVVSVLFRSPSDPTVLLLVAGVQVLICFMGYAIEALKATDANSAIPRYLFWVSIFVYALLWTALLVPFALAVSNAPAPVSVFIGFMILVFSAFPIIFLVSWRYTGDRLIRRELLYTAASFISKIPLLVLFYTGIVMRSGSVQFEGLDLNTDGDALSDSELYGVFGGTVLASIAFGSVILLKAHRIEAGK